MLTIAGGIILGFIAIGFMKFTIHCLNEDGIVGLIFPAIVALIAGSVIFFFAL